MEPITWPSLKNLTNPNYGKPPEESNELLQQLGRPHVNSFNYMINDGLPQAIENLDPVEFTFNGDRIRLQLEEPRIRKPRVPDGTIGVRDYNIYPKECRLRQGTYKGRLTVKVNVFVNDQLQTSFDKNMGEIPIMVRSDSCHLANLTPKELVGRGEHEQEWGGYFIVKGHEKLVRMLQMTRRNYPVAIRRPTWKSRGDFFSDLGIMMRCVSEDQSATNNILHYLTNGTAKLMFSHNRSIYFVPLMLMLKCLRETVDVYIYVQLMRGCHEDVHYENCLLEMLRDLHENGLHHTKDCKAYLGRMFRVKFPECPEWYTDVEVTDYIIKRCILTHLEKPDDKFDMLVFMAQKLYALAKNKCKVEGVDTIVTQELLTGGNLYLQLAKEKLQNWLSMFRAAILKKARESPSIQLTREELIKCAKYAGGIDLSLCHFIATGNLGLKTSLGLMQNTGLTISVENVNRLRYMSHFKAIHRGAFFQEMRTTEVRRLLPDSWGFICPVHTPDGAPCGLLNHLTANCIVTDVPDKEKVRKVPSLLRDLGMINLYEITHSCKLFDISKYYPVILDGKMLGYLPVKKLQKCVGYLREQKVEGVNIPNTLEIALVPKSEGLSQYSGLFLFTGPARMMRPVFNLITRSMEYIGTFEQAYLDICIYRDEFNPGITTHQEVSPGSILSNMGKLIPLSEFNQSPRNIYQCQMAKQTMGTPCHNWQNQAETKLYRLHTPQSPLFRPAHHDDIGLDDFAIGTNAVVAVISYTGYDMEDAIVINRDSVQRGFMRGSVYKTEFIELDQPKMYFRIDPKKPELSNYLDANGLPFVGRKMNPENPDEPLYCYYIEERNQYRVGYFKAREACYVDSVRLCGNVEGPDKQKATVIFRLLRVPVVGDKFASRAGQKGICSALWAAEDLPFTETGVVPDIIFNPHGFPSRMTVAMMIEVMAGKSAACHGLVHDATPFRFRDEHAHEYFGNLLEKAGYNYTGCETMYAGTTGKPLRAEIFTGIVYYQRLRHMVADKWQVRPTGPIDTLTKQPLKGRRRGGGIRFGEMERDSILSHGASFLLQDRLLHNSDKTTALICTACRTFLGVVEIPLSISDKPSQTTYKEVCRLCNQSKHVDCIQIPYIFRMFLNQLAAMNIHVKLDCDYK